jgi:heme/copper-type cytochrome/quinol oxidase subunit 3
MASVTVSEFVSGFLYNDDAREGMTMLNTKILLMSSMFPAAAWAASATMGPSLLIIQVICAIAISFALFMAILRMTEYKNTQHPRVVARARSALAALPAHGRRLRTI